MKIFAGYQKGINLGGWLSQCVHTTEHYESFISENDIEKIASWGMDHVRLPIDYNLVLTETGEMIESGYSYIDRCSEWCKKYGLNLIIDLHRTIGFSFDDTVDNNTFLFNTELQEKFYCLWEVISARYCNEVHIAFELLNEIDAGNAPDLWNSIVRTAIERVRKIAPERYILVGGINANSITSISKLEAPYDDRIVYNFHFYEPLLITHQGAYWVNGMPADFRISYPQSKAECLKYTETLLGKDFCGIYDYVDSDMVDAAFMDKVIGEAAAIASERGVAMYCGEYGILDLADMDTILNWYKDLYSVFAKYGIGNAAWNYKKMDFDLSGSRYDDVRKTLLAL